jgi:hypothetical protein
MSSVATCTGLPVRDLQMCWGDSCTKIDSVRKICADCGKRRSSQSALSLSFSETAQPDLHSECYGLFSPPPRKFTDFGVRELYTVPSMMMAKTLLPLTALSAASVVIIWSWTRYVSRSKSQALPYALALIGLGLCILSALFAIRVDIVGFPSPLTFVLVTLPIVCGWALWMRRATSESPTLNQ